MLLSAVPALSGQSPQTGKAADLSRDYPIKPVPFTAVHVDISSGRLASTQTVRSAFRWRSIIANGRAAWKISCAPRGNDVASNGIKEPKRVADDEDPSSSSDTTSYYDWYPRKGAREWIQYDFGKPKKISTSQVYWFAEQGRRQVKAPASWRLLYKDGEEWKPIETTDPYGVSVDEFNRVHFKPVETQALRLELQLQHDASAGIEEWRVQ